MLVCRKQWVVYLLHNTFTEINFLCTPKNAYNLAICLNFFALYGILFGLTLKKGKCLFFPKRALRPQPLHRRNAYGLYLDFIQQRYTKSVHDKLETTTQHLQTR
jgi:hypothetical protein